MTTLHFAFNGAAGQTTLVDALNWVVELLTGSLATLVATIAVAFIGYATLEGRIAPREAIKTLIGCFVLFGAVGMANALMDHAQASNDGLPVSPQSPPPAAPARAEPPQFDPYAGASVPN